VGEAAIEVSILECGVEEYCERVAFYCLEECPPLKVCVSSVEVSSDGIAVIFLFPARV